MDTRGQGGLLPLAQQGIPYQAHEELKDGDARAGTLFRVAGDNDLYALFYHTFTGSQHYYYVCDRMVIEAVCGYKELATVLYQYMESGISPETLQERMEG